MLQLRASSVATAATPSYAPYVVVSHHVSDNAFSPVDYRIVYSMNPLLDDDAGKNHFLRCDLSNMQIERQTCVPGTPETCTTVVVGANGFTSVSNMTYNCLEDPADLKDFTGIAADM